MCNDTVNISISNDDCNVNVDITTTIDEVTININEGISGDPLVYDVFGRTGNIVAQYGDYNAQLLPILDIGNYYTSENIEDTLQEIGLTIVNLTSEVNANTTHSTSTGEDHSYIDQDVTTTSSPTFVETLVNSINFNPTTPPIIVSEGSVWWNDKEYTLNIESGLGPILQIGQEVYLLYYNDTGVQIDNFSVLHLKSGITFNGYTYPTPELADASDWEKCQGTLAVATQDIPNGSLGFAILYGRARGGDTSGLVAGSQIWLSATTPGGLTSTKPMFPDYSISMGGAFNSSISPNGEIFINITKDIYDTFNDAWDGAIRETFNFTVTSNGTTITGSLENEDNTKDLTLLFSDDLYTFDVTPAATLTLSAGTTTIPQTNYIFIDKATKTLQANTTGFPSAEHAKVSIVAVLDASSTQTYGALRNHNINDHLKATNDNGHILHIAERLRVLNAEWDSGVAATLTGTTTNVYINTTAGVVYQLHKQVFPAQSMATGDDIHVVNDPTTPYRTTTNLNDITSYSSGLVWNNEWSNIVIWGVANKTGETSHIMCNLPSAGYTTEASAIADPNNYSNYTIPKIFKGVGFLIARFTIRRSTTTFTYNSSVGYLDLRGYFPNNTAGGGTGSSGITNYTQLSDTPLSITALAFQRGNAGATALENVLANSIGLSEFNNDLGGASGSFTTNDGKTITVTNGIITSIV